MDSTTFVNLPWFGNNQLLLDILDSLDYPMTEAEKISHPGIIPSRHIPIKLWIYRETNGQTPIQLNVIKNWVEELNDLHETAFSPLRFYVHCDITYIDDDDHTIVTDT
jgi:hypothetical protein